jgi:hypothetical protein
MRDAARGAQQQHCRCHDTAPCTDCAPSTHNHTRARAVAALIPRIGAAPWLQAEKLILMTDVPGVLKDKNDVSTKYPFLSIRECRELIEEGIIAGKCGHVQRPRPAARCSASWGVGLGLQACTAPCAARARTARCLPALPAGGMIPKIQCCIRCVSQGVTATHIIDGRSRHSILMELLTDEVGQRGGKKDHPQPWHVLLAAGWQPMPPHVSSALLVTPAGRRHHDHWVSDDRTLLRAPARGEGVTCGEGQLLSSAVEQPACAPGSVAMKAKTGVSVNTVGALRRTACDEERPQIAGCRPRCRV